MGMLSVLGLLFFLAVAYGVYWVATLFGWPYGYWVTVGTLLGSLTVIGLLHNGYKTLSRGFSVELAADLVVKKVPEPKVDFSVLVTGLDYSTQEVEIDRHNPDMAAVADRILPESRNHFSVTRFRDKDGQASFMSNHPDYTDTRGPLFWAGELTDIDSAKPLAFEGMNLRQATRLTDDLIIVALSEDRGFESEVLVLDGQGQKLGSLFKGRDLHWRDRGMEVIRYFKSESEQASLADRYEYYSVFMLAEDTFLVTLGTDTADYDGFFSTQGYSLPRLTKAFLVGQQYPAGKLVSRFTLGDGMPAAISVDNEKLYLQTLDARDVENPKRHFYQLQLNPEVEPVLENAEA